MAISKTTRTHLIYQFIILTLLFLGIGYNELLPGRKFLIFLAFLPIFCCQLIILSCCMELMPMPSWMSFLQQDDEKCNTKVGNTENVSDFDSSATDIPSLSDAKKIASLPEVNEISSYHRRWEKSVLNLGASPKVCDYPQRSKSWMNLSDSKSTESLLSREGSLDVLAALSESKPVSRVEKRSGKTRKREERAAKAKSWKLSVGSFDISDENEFTYYKEPPMKTKAEFPLLQNEDQEESELSKSYSFPIRQKRLETWLEMKETNASESEATRSPCMPYWQTVGYNLAVKYEARRRRRAVSTPTRADVSDEPSQNFQKTLENVSEVAPIDKSNSKKPVKSASTRINKLRTGFSNLISKKKEESPDGSSVNPNRASKSALFNKLKNKSTSSQTKDNDKPTGMPEFPQFLNNDRPLIFYPKNIPFEKERFESDVKKKMKELAEQQQNGYLQKIK